MYNTNKIDAILFDMDGTVLDSEKLFGIAEQRVLCDYGINAGLDELTIFRGMSEEVFYREFMSRFNIDEEIDTLKIKLKEYLFMIMQTDLQYINGFRDFYRDIIHPNAISTALVTNTSLDIVIKIDKFIDIGNYFSTIITSSDVSHPKPSPIPYQKAMRALGVDSKNSVIIEDSASGLRSAIDTGAMVIGLTSTLRESDIKDISPDIYIYNTYSEIKNFLEKYI